MDLTTIIETLRADYQRFPVAQSFELYSQEVWFKDPLTEFRGLKRYQQLIAFMERWFRHLHLELHQINGFPQEDPPQIRSNWTLTWTAPLPWQPVIVIAGTTTLLLDAQGKIKAHFDHWNCSPWWVLWQHIFPNSGATPHNGEG